MRILMVSHAVKRDIGIARTNGYVLEEHFRKNKTPVLQIYSDDWFKFIIKYREFNPDVILTIGPIAAFVAFFRRLGIIKKPVVFMWNDYYVEVMGEKYGDGFIGFLEKYAVKNSDGIISCSKIRAEIAKKLRKKTRFIENGIEPIEFNEVKNNFKGKNKISILYSGEQSKVKRIDKLVNAMKNINADLYLTGKTNEEIKNNSPENVYFLGFLSENELVNCIKKADFVIIADNNDASTKLHYYFAYAKRVLAPRDRIGPSWGKMNIHLYDGFGDINDLIKDKKRCERYIRYWDDSAKEIEEFLAEFVNKK